MSVPAAEMRPGMKSEKARVGSEQQQSALFRLLSYMKYHKLLLTLAFIILFAATGSGVVGPILIRRFIDTYLTPRYFPMHGIVILAGTFLFLQIASGLLNFWQVVLFQEIALKIVQRLRVELFSKVQSLSLTFFDNTPTGALISRITNDTEVIKDLYVSVLSSFVQNITLFIGIFISMFYLNAKLAALCLILLPIIFGVMMLYRRLTAKVFHLSRQKLSLLNTKLNESLQGMYLIQAMRQEKRLRGEFEEINQAYRAARMRNMNLNGLLLRPLVDVIYYLTLVTILGFFGFTSLHTRIDVGVAYAFLSYLDQFFEPVNDMMQRLNLFQQAIVAAERVFVLLDEDRVAYDLQPGEMLAAVATRAEVAADGADGTTAQSGIADAKATNAKATNAKAANAKATNATAAGTLAVGTPRNVIGQANVAPEIRTGLIEFQNVYFSYDGKTDVLKDISFTALPGQTVALVGHTGSGKSSIANLLLRFYPVERGRITIDGVPLNGFPNEELRRKIGLVLQDPFIFVGDLKRNIRLGEESISDEAIVEAAKYVQAHDFIMRLPNQYEEELGERGATLSSGQRQLVSFARTMAKGPKILVLDEATASIDTQTEEAIQTALERMRKGRTTIAIAHRLSTIQDADLILVLHHGEIVERGTHQELLAERGLYHKMYLLQQSGGGL